MPPEAGPDAMQAAIALLENEFSEEPNLKYSDLIKRLRESLDSNVNYNSMLGRIMVLRSKPAEEIGGDPLEEGYSATTSTESAKPASKSTPSSPPPTGRNKVFNTLFEALAQRIAIRGDHFVAKFKEHVADYAGKTDLPASCKAQLLEWTEKGQSPRIVGADDDLHGIINSIFVWACEKFGPVEADKILLEAVRITEQIPESFEHSPRKFL
jgi:hypothetical protein